MPPAVSTGLAIGGNLLGLYGDKRAADQQRAASQQAAGMMSPQAIMRGAYTLNPFLFSALGYTPPVMQGGGGPFGGAMARALGLRQGQYGAGQGVPQTGFQQALGNIVQDPGYIDPSLINMNLIQSMRQGQQGLLGAQGMLGRTGMQGGLADAYALANRAATTGRNMGILQNYNLAREQQRRQDISFIMNELARSQRTAAGLAGQQAELTAGTPPAYNMGQGLSDFISGGIGAYGAFQGQQAPQGVAGFAGGVPSLASPVNPTGKQLFYQPPFQSQSALFNTPQSPSISPVFGRNTNLFGTQGFGQGTR